jgi:hypothetical protein
MTDAGIHCCDAFRNTTGWRVAGESHAPNVEFVRERSLDEIEERIIGRPDGEMGVEPGRGDEYGWCRGFLKAVRDE